MEYGWADQFKAFGDEVRQFAKEFKTPEMEAALQEAGDEGQVSAATGKKIRDAVEARGWMRMCWPPEYGGEGKSAWYQYILSDVLTREGIPYSLGTAAMIGPALQKFGTDYQKEKYLPGLWSGDITCALGYSEPNAGTDLASLETRATRDGDEYVINGQKIWTSQAHTASHVWLAARTDPTAPKHRGVSMFIVPLDAQGISVRPIWTSAGIRTNETFYEDVRVPVDALIGEENRGWYIAANALDHERLVLGGYAPLTMTYGRLMAHLKQDRPEILRDRAARARLAEFVVDLHIMRALTLTNASVVAEGGTPTMQASMVKIYGSELRYRMNSTAMDLVGRYGAISPESKGVAAAEGAFEKEFRGSPVMRFGAGTNEVQRNIVAQRGLGLPRA